MKKVILLSLLLAPFAACKKDSITEVAQPAENIENITIVTDQVKNGDVSDRGTCNLYCATRYRATTDINSAAQTSAFTYQLIQRNTSTGVETAASPVLTQAYPGSTGKNITWVVPNVNGYQYFIKYGGFFPTGKYAHTYWADDIMVQVNPVANADVAEQKYTTANFNTVAANISATCVVTP